MKGKKSKDINGARGIEKSREKIKQAIVFFSSNWPVFLFILSIFGAFIGWVFFNISLFQPLEELAEKQREYRQVAEQDLIKGKMIERHLMLGDRFLDVMQLDAARIEFDEALKLDPLNISAKRGLFESEIFRPIIEGDYDPEIMEKRLKLILDENPNNSHAFLYLGQIYSSIDHEQALAYYQKAIEIDPFIPAAYFGIGVIRDRQKEYDEAFQMYEKALNLSNWNQVFIDNLGNQYYIRKQYDQAIKHYELLLRLNGLYLQAYYPLANAYRINGNLERARSDQELLVQLLNDTNVTSMRRNQDTWFFPLGYEDKVYFYDLTEKKFYAYYNLALTYYLVGNEKEALQYIKKAQDSHIDKQSEAEIKQLINFEINNLQEEQISFRNGTDEFRRRFLGE